MKLTTINISIKAGQVAKGGKVSVFADGNSAAYFSIMTDSFKRTMGGGLERAMEFHAVSVSNEVFDDLYDLISEGNYVHIVGEDCSYEKAGKTVKYIRAKQCSLLIDAKKVK